MNKKELQKKVIKILTDIEPWGYSESRKGAYKNLMKLFDAEKTIKSESGYEIEESEKYPNCFNIYDSNGNKVMYFCEDDGKNKARAEKWVEITQNI